MKLFNRTKRSARNTRRGTAMFEMLLAMPFVMLILLFIWYFGRNSVRVQRNQGMTRYQAWHAAGHGPSPTVDHVNGHPQMNDAFYGNSADAIRHSGNGNFPDDATDRWIDYATQVDERSGQLAAEMQESLAGGRTAHFSTDHNTTNKFLAVFNGPVRDTYTVIDHDWKFVNGANLRADAYHQKGPNASNLGPIRDAFYDDFDQGLESLDDSGNPFAQTLRGLYLNNPGYRGPEVIQ